MDEPTKVILSARQVFAIRDFRLLCLAHFISEFGNGMTSIGLIVLVTTLTGSTASVATIAFALAVPQIIFGLVAGVFVDRLDSKHVMVFSDFIRAIVVLGFIPATISGQLWLMYLLGFAQSTVSCFFRPAKMSMLPAVVPENGLMAANSMIHTSRVAANMLGAGAVGVLLGLLNVSYPIFVLDSLTFMASVLLVSAIRTQVAPPEPDQDTTSTFWKEFKEGIIFIASSPKLIGVIVAVGISDLGLGATQILYAPFFQKVLNVSAAWLGPDELVQSTAMALSGSLVVLLAVKFKPEFLAPLGLFVVAIGTGLVSVVSSVWLVLALSGLIGLAQLPMQTSVSTIFQRSTTRQIRGRVGAAIGTISQSSSLLSIVGAGLLSNLIGLKMMFLLVGFIALFGSVIAWWLFRLNDPQVTA